MLMLRRCFLLVAVCGCQLALAGAAGARMIEFDTDTSWKALGATSPASGWNTNLDFDDSSWASASLRRNRDLGGITISSIWAAVGTNPAWMRKEFTIDGPITAATLYSVIDDDADVYLNGNLIISDHNGSMQFDPPLDVTAYLTTGVNLLAVAAFDNQGGRSGDFGARLVVNPVYEPASAALLGVGIVSLLGRAGLRRARGLTTCPPSLAALSGRRSSPTVLPLATTTEDCGHVPAA